MTGLSEQGELNGCRNSRNARTLLGHRLWQIRERAIAAGLILLDQEAIAREVAERRGGLL